MQRNFLWKHQQASESPPLVLGLISRKKPVVKIRERVLNAAYQTYVDSKQALFVVGELRCCTSDAEGLDVEVNAVRGKPQPGATRPADFLASCRFCRRVEARDPNDTVLDLVEDVRTKQYSRGSSSAAAGSSSTACDLTIRRLTDYFSLDIHGKLEGPNCSVDVSFVCFERRLHAFSITSLPLADNSVLRWLSQIQKDLLWGWIRTCKGSCHLLQKDEVRQDAMGVWVSGVSSIYHPLVWLVCQHFLTSIQPTPVHARQPGPTLLQGDHSHGTTGARKSKGDTRASQRSIKDIFALVVFDRAGDTLSYAVSPVDDMMRTVVLSGVEQTTVTRVFSARDRLAEIPLEMCYVDDGNFTLDATAANHSVPRDTVLKQLSKGQMMRISTDSPVVEGLMEDFRTRLLKDQQCQTEKDDSDSYHVATKRDAPLLASPSCNGRQLFTPATVDAQKAHPKVTVPHLPPHADKSFPQFDSLREVRPSASSTPIDRILMQGQQLHQKHTQQRKSDVVHEAECVEANKDGKSERLPPELVELIQKQQQEISHLKEQVQLLLLANNQSQLADAKNNRRQLRFESDHLSEHRNAAERRDVHPVDQNGAEVQRQLLSPPQTPPRDFTPLCPYKPDSPELIEGKCHPFRGNYGTSNIVRGDISDKENCGLDGFLLSPLQFEVELSSGQMAEIMQFSESTTGTSFTPQEALPRQINGHSDSGGMEWDVKYPLSSFAIPRLVNQPKAADNAPAVQALRPVQPTAVSTNPIGTTTSSSTIIRPRLEYESLVLSGTQPSVLVDQVTKKYFGRSPQIPNTAAIVGPPNKAIAAAGKTTPVGMLRRVLTAEATKQVLGSNGQVSVMTRKYMQMEDVEQLDEQILNPSSRGKHEGVPHRFLDVDALKRQPKLL